jgi:D-inositol-3-phosphate glycosyltransferase
LSLAAVRVHKTIGLAGRTVNDLREHTGAYMPKRIALISDHASPLAAAGSVDSGGQNIYVAQIARQLAALGHSVDVFTRRDNRMQPQIVNWMEGVRIVHVPAGPSTYVRKEDLLPFMDDFAAFMRDFCAGHGKYDAVHANFFMSGLVAMKLKEALGTPFAITFHALGRVRRLHQKEADQFPDERITIEEQIVADADAIIAECPQDRSDLIELYGADERRIRIVPCGYDAAEFWPIGKRFARCALGFQPDSRLLVNIGRLVPRKGIDNAIRGVARLSRDHGIRASFVVVGGNSDCPDPTLTPEIARLQSVAEEEGIADQVSFIGRRSRELLKLYYSAADAFITTPWYEPFGITPLEAMACGVPVVGADVGGIRHSVVDGHTGYLVPPKDPDALAARLADLYNDADRLKQFSQNGLRRVKSQFTWKKVAKNVAAVYAQVSTTRGVRHVRHAAVVAV